MVFIELGTGTCGTRVNWYLGIAFFSHLVLIVLVLTALHSSELVPIVLVLTALHCSELVLIVLHCNELVLKVLVLTALHFLAIWYR